MKKLLFIFILFSSAAAGQNPNTLPKFLMEGARRINSADTAAFFVGAVPWGDSYSFGTGGTGDSTYPMRLQNISNLYVYPRGVPGESSTQIMNRFLANPEVWKYPTIIWSGRNNYTDSATVVSNVKRMVDSILVRHNRYLVISVMNGGGEPSGSSAYISVAKLNAGLASQFGNHYVDLRAFMVSQYDPTSPPDVTNFMQDIPPLSKRTDSIHFNNRGQDLNAKYIYSRFNDLLPQEVITTFGLKSLMNRMRINTGSDSSLFGPVQIRSGNVGLKSTSYSHTLTLGGQGAANGVAIYNTVDEITNREYFEMSALGATGYFFRALSSGTGSQRNITFTTQNTGLVLSSGGVTGAVNISRLLQGGNSSNLGITGNHQGTSGYSNALSILNTVNLSGSGAYRGLYVSPGITALGSGATYLMDLGVNAGTSGSGLHRSKFAVDTIGVIGLAPTYSTGGYDLLVKNQTTNRWETTALSGLVTSITGTTNQVIASASTGAVILSTPQNIHTGASPQFLNMGLGVAANPADALYISGGTWGGAVINSSGTINAVASANYNLHTLAGAIVEPSSGNAALYSNLHLSPISITDNAGTVTNTATLYIAAAATTTVSGGNYAILVNSGNTRLGGSLQATGELSIGAGVTLPIINISSSQTLSNVEYTVLVDATSGPITVTLPAAASHQGRVYVIKKVDASANVVTVARTGLNTIDGATSQTISAQWGSYTIQSSGLGWFLL